MKKTLTIPKWADRLGKELHLNFSKTLTDAIADKHLGAYQAESEKPDAVNALDKANYHDTLQSIIAESHEALERLVDQ